MEEEFSNVETNITFEPNRTILDIKFTRHGTRFLLHGILVKDGDKDLIIAE